MSTAPEIALPPALADWQQRGRFTRLLGHEMFYIDEGSDEQPVILLIHGFPTASFDWQPIWATLRQQYRVVALDMLGFGFSDKPNRRQYSIHQQADFFEALINQLQLSEFDVLAHDYGDTVAQELLARQLDGTGAGQWRSCCFLNGGLFPETHQALLTQKLLLSPLGPLVNRLFGRSKFDSTFSKVFGAASKPTSTQLDEFWALINYKDGKHLFHNLITYMNDRKQHRERWVQALQQSSVPLALINGSVDPVSGAHMVARYQALNCRLDYLKELLQIGHYPQVEDPQGVSAAYLEFLAQQRG